MMPATMNEAVCEAGAVTFRMFEAYRRMVEFYQRELGKTREEALQLVNDLTPEHLARLLHETPPEQVTFGDIGHLARLDPAVAQQKWQLVKDAARQQFLSGELAASALRPLGESLVWEYAQFIAIRQAMVEEWQPRGGIEYSLIDMLAQTYTLYLRTLETMTAYAYSERAHGEMCERKCGHRPDPDGRRYDGEQHAIEMADRFNRLFLRTLRQLRDLRRYAVTIHADQVNIGQQQINAIGKGE